MKSPAKSLIDDSNEYKPRVEVSCHEESPIKNILIATIRLVLSNSKHAKTAKDGNGRSKPAPNSILSSSVSGVDISSQSTWMCRSRSAARGRVVVHKPSAYRERGSGAPVRHFFWKMCCLGGFECMRGNIETVSTLDQIGSDWSCAVVDECELCECLLL